MAITAAEVKAYLAFHLKQNGIDDLPSPDLIDAEITAAIAMTAAQFTTALLKLGYSGAQITSWLDETEGEGYQKDQTLWRLLRSIASLDADDLWPEKFNVLKDFAPDVLVIDGVIVEPAGEDAGSGVGRFSYMDGVDVYGCGGTASGWTGRPRTYNGW